MNIYLQIIEDPFMLTEVLSCICDQYSNNFVSTRLEDDIELLELFAWSKSNFHENFWYNLYKKLQKLELKFGKKYIRDNIRIVKSPEINNYIIIDKKRPDFSSFHNIKGIP